MPLEVNLSLCLPTDEMSVPIVRHICQFSLTEVGVADHCLEDISVALTEACTNVLDHAVQDGEAYAVQIAIDDDRCIIRVKDAGGGFDFDSRSTQPRVDGDAESGRGLELIRALVDKVKFTSKPEDGMIVHLEKELEFDDGHPVRRRWQEVRDG
jgi:serine/threonine-protein kinase RsbW